MHMSAEDVARLSGTQALLGLPQAADIDPLLRRGGEQMTRPLEEYFSFATFLVWQIVAVTQQHEIRERHRLADGFEVPQPFLHRG